VTLAEYKEFLEVVEEAMDPYIEGDRDAARAAARAAAQVLIDAGAIDLDGYSAD